MISARLSLSCVTGPLPVTAGSFKSHYISMAPGDDRMISQMFDHDHLPPAASVVLLGQSFPRSRFGDCRIILYKVHPPIAAN
jgi:hypothetical protein